MATTDVSKVFLDTNVLVYLSIDQSPFHKVARAAILHHQNVGTEIWISRQILREYLATLTRPQTFIGSKQAISITALAAEVGLFQDRYKLAEDNQAITKELLALILKYPSGGKQIHDANIVATMLTYDITHILTHNTSDFSRFSDIITTLPLKQDS